MDSGWKQNSECVAGFLNFLRDIQTAYSVASQMEIDADNQTQDILHRLELNQDSAADMERMAQALQAIRKTRREAKDSKAKAEPVMRWIKENGGMGEVWDFKQKLYSKNKRFRGDIKKQAYRDGAVETSGRFWGVFKAYKRA